MLGFEWGLQGQRLTRGNEREELRWDFCSGHGGF